MQHATLWSSVTQSTLQMCYSKGFQLLTSQTACFGSECSFPPIWDYFDLFAYYMIAITLSLWDQRGPQKEHVNPTVNNRVRNYFLKFDCRAANIVSMFSKWEYKPRLWRWILWKIHLKTSNRSPALSKHTLLLCGSKFTLS